AYLFGAVIFCTGTLVCAFAPDMWVMLVGRAVQGGGGGLLYALAYAMIRQMFPQRLWPRAISLVSAMFGIATLLGPAIGGMFAEAGIWRAAFWSVAPAAILFGAIS